MSEERDGDHLLVGLACSVVRALSEWGTAQEPHAAAAPSTIEIASAIVRLLFMFHLVCG